MATGKDSILIVGAGCFGLSTAHHLASNGYANITVLEKDESVPSRFSAAHDINKVIRAEYADPFYTNLGLKAIHKWQTDPLYSPNFRQTGFLNVVSANAPEATKNVVQSYLESIQDHPAFKRQVSPVKGRADIIKLVPAFKGPLAGYSGYFNKLAGYGHSANALKSVYDDCVRMGVKFHLGTEDGAIEALLYSSARNGGTQCIGAKSRGGNFYFADKIILALGAHVANLLPSIGKQVTSTCLGVVHLQLTPEEAEALRGIPVTNVRDLAFFFEPDKATNKLKFCHMGAGYTNFAWSSDGFSLPFSELGDSDFVPAQDEVFIRRLLREVMPQFADRPLIDAHMCWLADTEDSDYIIDYVPGTGSSLIVLSGDSGHGFKMFPIFGEFVKPLLDEGFQSQRKWTWKESKPKAGQAWRSGGLQELASLPRAKL